MGVKNHVKMIRKEKGFTQQEMGKLLSVSRQTIVAIETGKYKPSLELALKIAQLFELPVEKIFILEEER